MAKKDDLIAKAAELKITLTGEETNPQLEAMIVGVEPEYVYKAEGSKPPAPSQEQMVPLSSVKQLIAEAMAQMAEKDKPAKVKKVTEHHAHVFRFDGQWVVDFADRNYDYEKKQIIDPYVKDKIHAYNKFNPEKREMESWIKIILQNGLMVDMPLNRYIERRTLVYCPIIRREKVDKSYVIGEVEKKKEVGELMKGTGIMIDQEVNMHQEIFHVRTPEGEVLVLPEHVIC